MLRIHLLVNPNIVTIIKATQKWEPPSTNTHNKMHEIIILKVQALIYWNRRGYSRWVRVQWVNVLTFEHENLSLEPSIHHKKAGCDPTLDFNPQSHSWRGAVLRA